MEEKKLTGYPSIDKPWLKYYDTQIISETTVPNQSVYQYIYDKNSAYLDDTALVFFEKKISYRKMFYEADKIADILTAKGLEQGDTILMCMTGTPETVELLLACSKIGVCAIMLNPTLPISELREIIEASDSEMIFCMDKLFPVIEPALSDIHNKQIIIIPVIFSLPRIIQLAFSIKEPISQSLRKGICDRQYKKWYAFLREDSSKAVPVDGNSNLPLAVVFTSGTTGKAKGIVHTNRSYVALSVEYQCNGYPFKRGDSFLYMIPSFIAAGLSYTLFAPLAQGITMILDPLYDAKQFVADIVKYKPNIIPGTKSFWYAAMNDIRMQNVDLSNLKIPVTGGEPVFVRDEANINRFLSEHKCRKKLYIGWGLSELNATITTTAEKGSSIGSSGIPLPNVTVSAFDVDTGEECIYGKYGELKVVSPCVMLGYYRNPSATAAFFSTDANGEKWCNTGDIGYVNEQGEVFALGRATDHYLTEDNKRVYLFDIENIIMRDNRVAQCKVVVMAFDGRTTAAAHIILEEGVHDVNTIILEIECLLRENLESPAIPKLYKVRNSFPLTPNGKRDIHQMQLEKDGFVYIENSSILPYSFGESGEPAVAHFS